MATWIQAVVLGIVQGATEFIPVSSSGHLVLVPYLAGWDSPGLAFDVALHVGSLLAALFFFRRELWAMARGVLTRSDSADARIYRRVALFVAAGSVPVAVMGLVLYEVIGAATQQPLVASGMLFLTAVLLTGGELLRTRRVRRAALAPTGADAAQRRVWDGDWVGPKPEDEEQPPGSLPTGADASDPLGSSLAELSWRQVLVIALAQCAALFPGVSRSGTTLVAGMAAGLTREAATRFSFLLSLPTLAGAAILSLDDLRVPDATFATGDIVLGVVASAIASFLAMRFLVALVARKRLSGFARYCIVAGAIGIVGYLMIGPPSAT